MVLTVTTNLGLDHDEDTMIPIKSLDLPTDIDVTKISCGGNHTVILLSTGRVLGCGDNSLGQLCSDDQAKQIIGWKEICSGYNVIDVTCCWDSTTIVTADGKVYSRGSGLKGELGLGSSNLENKSNFELVMDCSKYAGYRVYSSFQNCILVLDKKEDNGSIVYAWGNNTKCQINEPKSRRLASPIVMYETFEIRVANVVMGKDFNLLLTPQGKIIHVNGKTPEDFTKDFETRWKFAKELEVKSMWSSIHIRDKSDPNKIHSYGNNIHGQVFDQSQLSPSECIASFTTGSEHGILVSKDKDHNDHEMYQLSCWGWGEHGNCGSVQDHEEKQWVNDKHNVTSPLNPVAKAISRPMIYGGCATTWIVSNGPLAIL